jgi:hypothetical protein
MAREILFTIDRIARSAKGWVRAPIDQASVRHEVANELAFSRDPGHTVADWEAACGIESSF